jgi:hypothetical protein
MIDTGLPLVRPHVYTSSLTGLQWLTRAHCMSHLRSFWGRDLRENCNRAQRDNNKCHWN